MGVTERRGDGCGESELEGGEGGDDMGRGSDRRGEGRDGRKSGGRRSRGGRMVDGREERIERGGRGGGG